jgi:glucans biosynthesis protein C
MFARRRWRRLASACPVGQLSFPAYGNAGVRELHKEIARASFPSTSTTSAALDNLRGYAILGVLAFHSSIAYLSSQPLQAQPFDQPPYGWLANPIVDSARWIGLDLFCAFLYAHLMQLMFFLSGLFVWPSLRRKGVMAFAWDRFLRLGVPYVVGLIVLMPLLYYPVYAVTAVDKSPAAFWSHWMALPFWPNGQLWFLWCLLALNLVAGGVFAVAPRFGEWLARFSIAASPSAHFAVLIAASALAFLPLAAVYQPWEWRQFGPFAVQICYVLEYAVYFFAGLAVGAHGIERGLLAADGALARRWTIWVTGIPAGFLLWIIPTWLVISGAGAQVPGMQLLANFGLVLATATGCFGLLALFLRFSTPPRSPGGGGMAAAFRSWSENAYGIYFVHYPFVIWLQYLLLGFALSAVVKVALVFTLTLLLSWAASCAICSLPLGARLLRGERRVLAKASSR